MLARYDPNLRELLAIVWLLALYYAAGGLFTKVRNVTDRVRDSLLLALAIPLLLGFLNALSTWTELLAAALLCGARLFLCRKGRPATWNVRPERLSTDAVGYAIVSATLVAISWPQLVRPILQGDSLLYHLPNAATWATAHSFWTDGTLYWWYAPGSEMFAADMLLIGGPGSLPISGLVASLLLGFRFIEFGRRFDVSPWQSGALSAAFVSLPIAALQAGTLQNDVWLSAWLVEVVWSGLNDNEAIYRTVATCTLMKPIGFVLAAFASMLFGSSLAILLSFIPVAAWALRDGGCQVV